MLCALVSQYTSLGLRVNHRICSQDRLGLFVLPSGGAFGLIHSSSSGSYHPSLCSANRV